MTERKRVSASAPTLDDLVAQAVALENEIASLPPRKLSAAAFERQALERAHADATALDSLAMLLPEAPSVRVYVSDLAKLIHNGNLTAPPSYERMPKLTAFGPPSLSGDLASIGGNVWLALALAVRECARRWPDSFGTHDDLTAFDKNAAALRDQLERCYRAMPTALSGADVLFDQDTLTNPERDRGLAYVRFRRWPGVVFAPDWPKRLVAHALAEAEAKAAAA